MDHRRHCVLYKNLEAAPVNRYKLVCRNRDLEEIFTVEGYETEREAQDMLDILNTSRRLEGNAQQTEQATWYIEPLHYN